MNGHKSISVLALMLVFAMILSLSGCQVDTSEIEQSIRYKISDNYAVSCRIVDIEQTDRNDYNFYGLITIADKPLVFRGDASVHANDRMTATCDVVARYACREVENIIVAEFARFGIDVSAYVEAKNAGFWFDTTEILSLSMFLALYSPSEFEVEIICQEKHVSRLDDETLEDVYSSVYSQIQQVKITSIIRGIDDTQFEDCCEKMLMLPYVNQQQKQEYDIVEIARVEYSDNTFDMFEAQSPIISPFVLS